jgi:HEAT repeat protein
MDTSSPYNATSEPGVAGDRSPGAGHPAVRWALWLGIIALISCVALWRLSRDWRPGRDALTEVIDALGSSSPAERGNAVRQLSQLGMSDIPRALPPLIKLFDDSDARVRAQAAGALGILGSYAVYSQGSDARSGGSDEAFPGTALTALLTALAQDQDRSVRAAAAGALRNICATKVARSSAGKGSAKGSKKGSGPPAEAAPPAGRPPLEYDRIVDALVAALRDPDEHVRAAAAEAMGAAGPKIAAAPPEPLVAALVEPSPLVRAATVSALPNFADCGPVLPMLINLAASEESEVREACTVALGKLRPPAITGKNVPALIDGLKNPDRDVQTKVIALLSRLGPDARPAIPALILALKSPLESDHLALGGPGGAASSVYAGPAHDSAKLLGKIARGTSAAAQAIAALSEVVRSGPPQRRSSAAEALGEFGPSAAAAVPDLIELLKATDPPNLTAPTHNGEAAAEALAKIAPGADPAVAKAAAAALKFALAAPSRDTRAASIHALKRFGANAADAVPAIKALLDDSDPQVRNAASETLKSLDSHKSG